jgi:hypothetical protein
MTAATRASSMALLLSVVALSAPARAQPLQNEAKRVWGACRVDVDHDCAVQDLRPAVRTRLERELADRRYGPLAEQLQRPTAPGDLARAALAADRDGSLVLSSIGLASALSDPRLQRLGPLDSVVRLAYARILASPLDRWSLPADELIRSSELILQPAIDAHAGALDPVTLLVAAYLRGAADGPLNALCRSLLRRQRPLQARECILQGRSRVNDPDQLLMDAYAQLPRLTREDMTRLSVESRLLDYSMNIVLNCLGSGLMTSQGWQSGFPVRPGLAGLFLRLADGAETRGSQRCFLAAGTTSCMRELAEARRCDHVEVLARYAELLARDDRRAYDGFLESLFASNGALYLELHGNAKNLDVLRALVALHLTLAHLLAGQSSPRSAPWMSASYHVGRARALWPQLYSGEALARQLLPPGVADLFCASEVMPSTFDAHGYRERGDRCEGRIIQPVAGRLQLVSLTQSRFDFDPTRNDVRLWWSPPRRRDVCIQALPTRPDVGWIMNTQIGAGELEFRWNLLGARAAGLPAGSLGLVARECTVGAGSLYVPLRTREGDRGQGFVALVQAPYRPRAIYMTVTAEQRDGRPLILLPRQALPVPDGARPTIVIDVPSLPRVPGVISVAIEAFDATPSPDVLSFAFANNG